jgi:heptosyltransferase-2
MHVAEAVGTPVVAVFGSTTPKQGFAPRDPRSRVVEVDLECRPCGRHGRNACPLGHFRCMLDLPAATVTTAVSTPLFDGQDVLAKQKAGRDS